MLRRQSLQAAPGVAVSHKSHVALTNRLIGERVSHQVEVVDFPEAFEVLPKLLVVHVLQGQIPDEKLPVFWARLNVLGSPAQGQLVNEDGRAETAVGPPAQSPALASDDAMLQKVPVSDLCFVQTGGRLDRHRSVAQPDVRDAFFHARTFARVFGVPLLFQDKGRKAPEWREYELEALLRPRRREPPEDEAALDLARKLLMQLRDGLGQFRFARVRLGPLLAPQDEVKLRTLGYIDWQGRLPASAVHLRAG
mmetsp:Transcript_89556/g.252382  ORF Transcript_89556/g.252382 Transcript_89556/m.252382 type:complete len:251 (-) Transcript_89556:1119-1871(-)